MLYGFVADQISSNPSLQDVSLVLRFEDLCANPQSALTRLCVHCGISAGDVVGRHAERLHSPAYYQAKFSESALNAIDQETRLVRQRFDYE